MAIDRFYSQSSNEFLAQVHVRDYIFHDPNITVQTMAACAAYAAVLRYVTRGDEYPIAPRNPRELRSMLNNHCMDVIHSLISQTRAQIPTGGYRLARKLAFDSIDSMLRTGDNTDVLLAIHNTTSTTTPMTMSMSMSMQRPNGNEFDFEDSQSFLPPRGARGTA